MARLTHYALSYRLATLQRYTYSLCIHFFNVTLLANILKFINIMLTTTLILTLILIQNQMLNKLKQSQSL